MIVRVFASWGDEDTRVFSLPMKADYISLSFVFRLDSSE